MLKWIKKKIKILRNRGRKTPQSAWRNLIISGIKRSILSAGGRVDKGELLEFFKSLLYLTSIQYVGDIIDNLIEKVKNRLWLWFQEIFVYGRLEDHDRMRWNMLKDFLKYVTIEHPECFALFLIIIWFLLWWYHLPETHFLKYYTIFVSLETKKEHSAGTAEGWYVIYLHIKKGTDKRKIIVVSMLQVKWNELVNTIIYDFIFIALLTLMWVYSIELIKLTVEGIIYWAPIIYKLHMNNWDDLFKNKPETVALVCLIVWCLVEFWSWWTRKKK